MPKFRLKIEPSEEAVNELKEKTQILETILGDQQFFAGDKVTLADISLGCSVPFLKEIQPELFTAKLEAWFVRLCKAVPAFVEYNDQATQAYKEIMEKK